MSNIMSFKAIGFNYDPPCTLMVSADDMPPGSEILALDPGLNFGWAGMSMGASGDMVLHRAGVCRVLDTGRGLFANAYQITDALLRYVEPDRVALEQAFVPKGALCGATFEMRGAIKACLEHRGFSKKSVPSSTMNHYEELNPSTVRSRLGVRGKLTDKGYRELVCGRLGLPERLRVDGKGRELVLPSDLIDAAALGLALPH